jgi:integrase
VSETNLEKFAQFLCNSFKSVSSVSNYVAGLKTIHNLLDYQFPNISSFKLNTLIKGNKNLKCHTVKQAAPVTPDILLRIYQQLDHKNPLQVSLWAAFLMGFFLFARLSNLLPRSPGLFDPTKQLTRKDIILGKDGLIVIIKWSKTIQSRERILSIPIMKIQGSILCPWQAIVNLLRISPCDPQFSAFTFLSNDGPRILTQTMFISKLRLILAGLGFQSSFYSGHSFRRAGASWAFTTGVPSELIQSHGDWKSMCYLRYLSFSIQDKKSVSQVMGNKLL